jgi:hypothetical protein
MKRLLKSALVATVVAMGAGGVAQAQTMSNRRASQAELGIYAGGAYSTSWFSITRNNEDVGYHPGLSPIFGAEAAYYFTPMLGLRVNGAYMPTKLPHESGVDVGADGRHAFVVNNWIYDLDLVLRPWIMSEGSTMSSMYAFLGGGGFTSVTHAQKTAGGQCFANPGYLVNGVCQPTDTKLGTVGQGTVGIGFDLFPLTSSIGLFTEAAVTGYDSPSHVTGTRAEDKIAFTPRLVVGLKAAFGNLIPPPPIVVPPAPEPMPVPVPTPTPVVQTQDVNYCVIQNNTLSNVTVTYNPTSGDTTYNGTAVATAFPATTGYAAGSTWFINNDAITFMGRRYVKLGLPRILGVSEVTGAGMYEGVPVFAENGAMPAPAANGRQSGPDVIYIPVRPGCEFQPYQAEQVIKRVRG